MSSLFPVRDLKRTDFLEVKKREGGGGEKKEKKIQCQMSCFCEQDSQVNESNTHLVTL